MRDLLGTKRCGKGRECPHGGRVRVRNGEDTEHGHEDHVVVTYKDEEDRGTGERVYFHADCAPFGATRLPDQLGIDGGEDGGN